MINIKNTLLFICVLFFSIDMTAQSIVVNLKMNPNVSPYIDEWIEGNANAELQMINNSMEEIKIHAKVEIYRNGEVVASNASNFAEVNPFLLQPGFNSYVPDDFFTYVEFNESAYPKEEKEYITTTKKLPSGTYEICLQILDFETLEPLSGVIPDNPACFPFFIMSYSPPALIYPQDDAVIDTEKQASTTFQWTSVVPFYPNEVMYELKIYEQFEEQIKEQAALSNPAIWSKKMPFTQTIIDFDNIPLDPKQKYVWQVRAVDDEGVSIGDNSGYSEVWRFQMESLNFKPEPPVDIYAGLKEMGPTTITALELLVPEEPLNPQNCCEGWSVDPNDPCKLISLGDQSCCPPGDTHIITTTGGRKVFGSGYGRMLSPGVGITGDCYEKAGDVIHVRLDYAIFTDCNLVPKVCSNSPNFPCSNDVVKPVSIESNIYKNGTKIEITTSPSISPRIEGLTFTNALGRISHNVVRSVDSLDYEYACVVTKEGNDTSVCAALFVLEFDIVDTAPFRYTRGSRFIRNYALDEYQIATIITQHLGHSFASINTNSLNGLAAFKATLSNSADADHIDIVPLMIQGTKTCYTAPEPEPAPVVDDAISAPNDIDKVIDDTKGIDNIKENGEKKEKAIEKQEKKEKKKAEKEGRKASKRGKKKGDRDNNKRRSKDRKRRK